MKVTYPPTKITKSQMNEIFKNHNHFVLRDTGLIVEFKRAGRGWSVTVNGKKASHLREDDFMSNQQAKMLFDGYRNETLFLVGDEDQEVKEPEYNTIILSNGLRRTEYRVYQDHAVVSGQGYLQGYKMTLTELDRSLRDHAIMGHYRIK